MIDVKVDQAAIKALVSQFDATPKQVQRARASALRKMRKRIETEVKRQAAKELGMPQKALIGRFYSDPVKAADTATKVWIGTHPVSPFNLGSVGEYGEKGRPFSGVMVGKRKYIGAFLATIYTADRKIWIRLRSRFYQPELYPTRIRPGDRGLSDNPRLRGRFPVVRAAVPVDAVLAKVVAKYGDDIAADFEKIFTQDLNYFTNIAGKP